MNSRGDSTIGGGAVGSLRKGPSRNSNYSCLRRGLDFFPSFLLREAISAHGLCVGARASMRDCM
eukprot:4249931-Pleurochrysis_carterae.AAC.1